jgi:tetratricopeptide (TPR) repeat protein
VNAQTDSLVRRDVGAPAVDERNPWLGLASFTEETRAYFYGREDEVAELARRVQRKLLTVLFGQSGLGKTSILRAGLVPRLRAQGYCPVYVRVDYGRDAPEPTEQIKQAIARSARRAGEWTRVGVAAEDESLWEYLHHRDDVLRDEAGNTLIPLLIFDQFEEIFTLAQSDDFGRARAARFIADLADLVENRAPKSLEAKLDSDDSLAEHFDFARSDYRVLIALREDYLAPLEGLKAVMPSITQNRLRLAPMTGAQALTAVMRPGKGLVSEEVAAAIVRFVAGGAELANAEVEPSLLSLICRELNDARIAQGRDEISLDLLAGSHASILSNFYERALADQLPAVRRIIEDELLTASGFRENIAEERLVRSLTAAGAAADTLAVLVNRRLLRIEERLDVRRVELTHDVLCGVVKASRDERHERDAREATERVLAEQRERELAARHALVRARQVAAVCAVLAIGAVLAALLAYLSTQRAHRAERLAEQTRTAAEQARGQAEQLLGYLTDDFARELESSGRLDVAAELARREVDYFHALPASLKGPDSVRNGALALLQYAKATRTLGDLDAATAADSEALTLLGQLRQAGDNSEATTIALARATQIKARILANQQSPDALPTARRAVELIKPITDLPNASRAARRAEVEVVFFLGYLQTQDLTMSEKAVATLQQAMELAAQLGGRDLSDLNMAALYAECGTWRVANLISLGRSQEARQVAADAGAVAEQVLVLRPGHRIALHALEVMQSGQAELASSELRPAEALAMGRRGEATAQALVTLDPKNTISFNNLAAVRMDLGEASWAAGQPRESLDYYQKAIADMRHAEGAGAEFVLNQLFPLSVMAGRQADLGDTAAAETALGSATKFVTGLHSSEPAGSPVPLFGDCNLRIGLEAGALWRGDLAAARRIGAEIVALMQGIKPNGGYQEFYKFACIFYPDRLKGEAEYLLGDYAAADQTLNQALEARTHWPMNTDDNRREQVEVSTMLSLALLGEHRRDEAQRVIEPVVKYHRELAARNHGDEQQHVELARALYAQALIEPEHRTALLREAASLVDAVPVQMRALRSVRVWSDRIHAATHEPAAGLAPTAASRGVG